MSEIQQEVDPFKHKTGHKRYWAVEVATDLDSWRTRDDCLFMVFVEALHWEVVVRAAAAASSCFALVDLKTLQPHA